LQNAEGYLKGKSGKKPIGTVAREAVQMAEDARLITVKKRQEENLANERQAGADRQARTEGERAAAQTETERVRREAETAHASSLAEADRIKHETDAQRAAAQADIARAHAASAEALLQQKAAQAETETARRATLEANELRLKAEAEKGELRSQLLQQFNLVLETRDTARGLIVNMSDVLFDTAKYSLRPGAREKLAKVAGIIAGHPGLKLEVEGHTDNVGGDDFNQNLSEQRGVAVRDYLTQQGISNSAVTTRGFGKPSRSSRTTPPPAGNRIVASSWLSRVKSSVCS